jgi:GTP cyclohydrolase I
MNQITDLLHIPDTQNERDERHLVIQRVGIKDVRYPLQIKLGAQVQPTVGNWDLDVALPAEKKGTHMSRLIVVAGRLNEPLDGGHAEDRAGSDAGQAARHRRPHRGALSRSSSASARRCRGSKACSTTKALDRRNPRRPTAIWAEVAVPVKSLCPCSKEISDYGAHNQRSLVTSASS